MTASTRLYARIKVKPPANPFLVEINCTVFFSHHMTQSSMVLTKRQWSILGGVVQYYLPPYGYRSSDCSTTQTRKGKL